MNRGIAALSFLAALVAVSTVSAAPIYEGSSNSLPTAAPWNWIDLSSGSPTKTAGSGVIDIDTTGALSDHAGYATHFPLNLSVHPDLTTLNRATGYRVEFGLKLLSEDHSISSDRAGFSVIVLSSDLMGIELGFWTNEVWGQAVGFTHAESSGAFNTTAALVDYRLEVLGSTYNLFANNVNIISAGSLRNYSSYNTGVPLDGHFPYDRPNFTFFGDDTGAAGGKADVSYFRVIVPEPSSLVLCALGIAAIGVFKSRRRAG